jgi:hypothetical protein
MIDARIGFRYESWCRASGLCVGLLGRMTTRHWQGDSCSSELEKA